MNIACGTGHRLQDMPCKFERKNPWKIHRINSLINYLKTDPPAFIISGFAIGWDQWLAYGALKMGIPLRAYLPFKGQESMWSSEHQEQYHEMLGKCQEVRYICDEGYSPSKMHRRNDEMLKDSNLVLALWNPQKKYGGTFSTVQKALKLKRVIINFWSETPSSVFDV